MGVMWSLSVLFDLMLRIFTRAYWPFACLLWRNDYLDSLPIFPLGYLSFYYKSLTKYMISNLLF